MKKQSGFQVFKALMKAYKPGDIIYPLDLYKELNQIIKKDSVDALLHKFRKCGYIFNLISLNTCYCKCVYVRSTKTISENLNSTIIDNEISLLSKIDLNSKFRTNLRYGYMLFSEDLTTLNWIKKSKVKDYRMQEFLKVLSKIGLFKEETLMYCLRLIHPAEYNIPFNVMVELYNNRSFIPSNLLKEKFYHE